MKTPKILSTHSFEIAGEFFFRDNFFTRKSQNFMYAEKKRSIGLLCVCFPHFSRVCAGKRWLAFTHHAGNTYPGTSTDTLQPRSPPRMELPLEASTGGMTAPLGGGDNVVMEHMVCQESFEETSGSFSGSFPRSFSGRCCWEGRDQRCLHEGSSNDIADQEEGMRRVSKQSSSPVLPSLSSDIEDVSGAVGKFSEVSKAGMDKVGKGEAPGRGS